MRQTHILSVRITPNAQSTTRTAVLADGSWKIAVAAPPERDKANRELIRFLAAQFRVTKEHVTILRGKTSRHKVVRIELKNLSPHNL